jgi:hypothetical protein
MTQLCFERSSQRVVDIEDEEFELHHSIVWLRRISAEKSPRCAFRLIKKSIEIRAASKTNQAATNVSAVAPETLPSFFNKQGRK